MKAETSCASSEAFSRLLSPIPDNRDKGGTKRRRGGAGTPCPSSPPLIAGALAEHHGKGSPLYGRTWMCVCVFMKNDFTGPLMMQAPFHPHFRGRENSRGGLVRCGRGSQNPLINYVMEKCLRRLRVCVWGGRNVAVCEQLALMRWEAGKHAAPLKRGAVRSLLSAEKKEKVEEVGLERLLKEGVAPPSHPPPSWGGEGGGGTRE